MKIKEISKKEQRKINGGTFLGFLAGMVLGALHRAGDSEATVRSMGCGGVPGKIQGSPREPHGVPLSRRQPRSVGAPGRRTEFAQLAQQAGQYPAAE